MVVDKPQSTRVEEPTLLWNQVNFYFTSPVVRLLRNWARILSTAMPRDFARGFFNAYLES